MTGKIDRLATNPFLDGPGEYLVKTIAQKIVLVPQFSTVFGDFIDSYMRMDYGIRNLPALRIYNKTFTKEFESWFINGEILMDCIWPANIRREETQQLPDMISAALLQQFRRITFMGDVETATQDEDAALEGYKTIGVPGLNELGKRFSVDKSLGFETSDNHVVPLTQITLNFRIDLRQWDEYLEENDRTVDDPFDITLGDLQQVVTNIQGLRDDDSVSVEVGIDQTITDE